MYKRPAIDEELYYEMARAAAQARMSVKQWLTAAIQKELQRQKNEIIDLFVEEDVPKD